MPENDPEGTASKKVKQKEKDEEQDALNQAAEEFRRQKQIEEGIYKIEEMDMEEKRKPARSVNYPVAGYPWKKERSMLQQEALPCPPKQNQGEQPSQQCQCGVIWMMTLAGESIGSS